MPSKLGSLRRGLCGRRTLQMRVGRSQDFPGACIRETLNGGVKWKIRGADMFVAEPHFCVAHFREEKHYRLMNQLMMAISEVVVDFLMKARRRDRILQASFFLQLANGGDQITFPFFDMSLGEIPVPAIVEQQVFEPSFALRRKITNPAER